MVHEFFQNASPKLPNRLNSDYTDTRTRGLLEFRNPYFNSTPTVIIDPTLSQIFNLDLDPNPISKDKTIAELLLSLW